MIRFTKGGIVIALVLFGSLCYAQINPSWNLPDYSHAGYHRSEVPLPNVSATHTVFDVTNYGAVPDDNNSDRAAIVSAISAASAHNGPAVVFFPEGQFLIRELSDYGQPGIVIKSDNVVLQGSGMGKTELFARHPIFRSDGAMILFSADRPTRPYFRGDQNMTAITSYPVSGGYTLNVQSTAGLSVGMFVSIDADLNVNTQAGIDYFDPLAVLQGVKDRKGGDNDYLFEIHEITSINGNTLTFGEPIKMAMNYMEDARLWKIDYHIKESGIEDLTLRGNYHESFSHHAGSRQGESFKMIRYDDAVNCWARNIRLVDITNPIGVFRSAFNTYTNILIEGNNGHQGFNVEQGAYGNLFSYIRENTECHHGFGGRQGATNTVFSRCMQYRNLEAHGGWMRHTLFDMNEGDFFKLRGGGARKFPFHGKGLCYWNWKSTTPGSVDFWPIGNDYGYVMPPYVVGLHGVDFNNVTDAELTASAGVKRNPESLFEEQLKQRLGSLPAWMATESNMYETISRYSSVKITSPVDQTQVNLVGNSITVNMAVHADMNTSKVQNVELWASNTSINDGFTKVNSANGWQSSLSFTPGQEGVWALRARMTNTRDEVTDSKVVVVYIGNESILQQRAVQASTYVSVGQKDYNGFKSQGGGEGKLPSFNNSLPSFLFYTVESAYYNELQQFYLDYGQNTAKPVFDSQASINKGNRMTDGNLTTTIEDIYHYSAPSILQFDLGSQQTVDRIDFNWVSAKPTDCKLEIQTSSDANAWYSIVNDEPLWEFGVARLGTTLSNTAMPGNNQLSSVYIPQQKCRYVRLLAKRFPNNQLSQVKIYGGPETQQAQTAYPNGVAHTIPGTIEVEDFDNGGEGVAYHDISNGNSGNSYRTTENVDIQVSGEGGFNVGWTSTGEWLEYTVDVANAGDYTLEARVASINSNGKIRVEFNGVDKTGQWNIPNTGNWQTYTTISKTVNLTAGIQVMRIFLIQGGENLEWMKFTSIGSAPVVSFIKPTLQQFDQGVDLVVEAGATDDGSIANIKLYLDNVLVRQESFAPYEWGHTPTNDPVLKNMAAGTYVLKTVAEDDGGLTGEVSMTITVNTPQVIENLALNQSVTASSTPEPANAGPNAVDGNTGTRWSASGFPQWLEVDLGAVKSISSTELVCFADRAYQYIVEAKTTAGGAYTQLVNRSANTTPGTVTSPITDSFSAVNARYVRITVSGASGYTGSWVSLMEFRVFGVNAAGARLSDDSNPFDNSSAEMSIYPNPVTSGVAHIVFKKKVNVDLQLLNITGHVMFSKQYTDIYRTSLNLKDYPSGSYLVRVKTGDGTLIRKVMLR